MELEFFCAPGTDLEWHAYWKEYCMNFLLNLGIRKENLRFRDHSPEELAFYSNATADIEFVFPFGWGELWGIADRTDYDLKQHMEQTKNTFRIVLSRHLVQTELHLHSLLRHMTKKNLRVATQELLCTCIRHLHR